MQAFPSRPFPLEAKEAGEDRDHPLSGPGPNALPCAAGMVEDAVPDSPHPLLSAVPTQVTGAARRAVAGEDSLASSQAYPGALTEGQTQKGL